MQARTTFDLWQIFNPMRLAGPIFDKELRVASRRGRTYWLRCGYIVLLSLFLVPQVLAMSLSQPSITRTSMMGSLAMSSVLTIIWFQFLMGQILAVALLSGAIGDEVRRRSLDALLVSPISSIQIVLGKLFSRLLQLVLLLALSVPLLSVIRAFGGVPWDQIVAAVCVTLAATIFTGSLSLFLSATDRNSQNVAAATIAWCLLAWLGLPALSLLLHWKGYIASSTREIVLYLGSPFFVLADQTRRIMAPGLGGAHAYHSWPLHCLLLLGIATCILRRAIRRVRRVAPASAARGGDVSLAEPGAASPRRWSGRKAVRRVTGSPIAWREVRRPILSRGWRRVTQTILLALVICGTLGLLVYFSLTDLESFRPACIMIAAALEMLFAFNVASSAASSITREKEARSLMVLLTIPARGRGIIKDKAIGILRRDLPLLLPVPVLGFLVIATAGEGFHLRDLLGMAGFEIKFIGNIAFLMGLGFCLSVYLRTTVAAVVLTFGLFAASKIFAGIVVGFLSFVSYRAFGTSAIPIVSFVAAAVQAVLYGGIGMILGYVAGGALRPNCRG